MELEEGAGLVKIVKTSSWFQRYQVKYKRRRQCKTNYKRRKKLIVQDKNKYGTPKYRFSVRFSNKDIMCQIFSAGLTHDSCIVSAYSHELRRYGIKLGLTNYAAAYCTGLLLARRLNTKFKLDYEGNTEDLGEYYEVEANEEGAAPFCALLDTGLKRATTGSRMFGALKGACDGGIDIPHGDKRFPRPKSDAQGKDYEPDAEFHRKYIFGGHVAEYMTKLKDEDEEAFKRQFSKYIKEGIEPDDLEGLYEAAHKGIREEPNRRRGPLELGRFKTRKQKADNNHRFVHKKWPCHRVKLTVKQRKERIKEKLLAMGIKKTFKNLKDQQTKQNLALKYKKKHHRSKMRKYKIRQAVRKDQKARRAAKGQYGPAPHRGGGIDLRQGKGCLKWKAEKKRKACVDKLRQNKKAKTDAKGKDAKGKDAKGKDAKAKKGKTDKKTKGKKKKAAQ